MPLPKIDNTATCLLYTSIAQQNPGEIIHYKLISANGPDHAKIFEVHCFLNSNLLGKGTGKSKKEAEQMAAREALKMLGEERP